MELKATQSLLLDFDTLDDYFTSHRAIRSQMIVASYPAIAAEITTLKYIIRCFANHPDFRYVSTTWPGSLPRPSKTYKQWKRALNQ